MHLRGDSRRLGGVRDYPGEVRPQATVSPFPGPHLPPAPRSRSRSGSFDISAAKLAKPSAQERRIDQGVNTGQGLGLHLMSTIHPPTGVRSCHLARQTAPPTTISPPSPSPSQVVPFCLCCPLLQRSLVSLAPFGLTCLG